MLMWRKGNIKAQGKCESKDQALTLYTEGKSMARICWNRQGIWREASHWQWGRERKGIEEGEIATATIETLPIYIFWGAKAVL